jgi:uncharacterized protein YbcI
VGEHRQLRDTRMLFQHSNVSSFIEPVEQVTGRRVRSFITGIDAEEDISIGTFLLHPRAGDSPPPASDGQAT